MAFDLQSCGRTHFCHFKPRSLWSFVTAAAGASRGSWSSRVWWAPGPGKKQEGTGRQGRRRQEGDPPARSVHAGGLEERASRGAQRGALHAWPRSVGFARQENAKSRLNALQQDGHAQSPGRCRVGGGQSPGMLLRAAHLNTSGEMVSLSLQCQADGFRCVSETRRS